MDAFVRFPVDIYYSDELTPQDKIVFGHILNQQNMSGGEPVQQSLTKIGKALNIPATTVRDSVRKLGELGFIDVHRGHAYSYSVREVVAQSRASVAQDRARDAQSRASVAQSRASVAQTYTLYKRNKRNIRKEECHARAARASLLNISREDDDYSFLPLIEDVK